MDNLGLWIPQGSSSPQKTITAPGTYLLRTNQFDKNGYVSIGARAITGEFVVQFAAEAAGAFSNLGTAQTVAAGTPVIWPEEYSIVGNRCIIVTVTTPGELEVVVNQ